jgi:hypothetical protein
VVDGEGTVVLVEAGEGIEENRRSTMTLQSPDMVVAAAPPSKFHHGRSTSQSYHKNLVCNYCHKPGHLISACPKLQFKRNQPRAPFQHAAAVTSSGSSAPESSIGNPSQSSTLTTTDVEALIHQVLSRTSIALSITSGKNSWFMDSACCNHMTLIPLCFLKYFFS